MTEIGPRARASRSRCLTRKRGSQHPVNGCCALRTRLHDRACRTTADRTAAHLKSDRRRDDLYGGEFSKRVVNW